MNFLRIKIKEYLDKNKFMSSLFIHGIWMTIRQVIVLGSGLALSIAFARLATQEVFGQYQLILSILSVVSIVSIPGLNMSILGSTARGFEGSFTRAVRTSFLWSLIGIPVLLAVGGYYYIYENPTVGLAFMALSLFFPFLYAPNTWDSFLQGKERFDVASRYSSIQALINAATIIAILFLFKDNLLLIVVAYALTLAFFNIVWYKKSLRYVENKNEDKETIPYGWFVTKIQILSLIAGNLDKVLIGIFIGPVQLAVYAIGINFSKKILYFVKSLLGVATPTISKKNTVSMKLYSKIFILATIFAGALFLFMPVLIPFLFSNKYVDSILLSQLVVAFLPFYILNILYKNHFLLYLKNKRILFYESIIFPITKILLMIPLIYFFGIIGLAFLIGFQNILNMAVLYLLHKKNKQVVK
ncbi:hypothetical protein COB64_00475 [Candidatus Wolfebacteria bacterium]|nr:MAG: hypothetical protein COB64_00475 [Candidatus Wolfebacteria bacterium]